MKNCFVKIYYLIAFSLIFCSSKLLSQATAPQGINYQAIARDNQGNVFVNQEISLRISVLSGNEQGEVEYVETHFETTNSFGLVNIIIGSGVPVNGTFESVNWSSANHWLKIEMDINGGNDYQEIGNNQLLSVPYALYAEKSGDGGGQIGPQGPPGPAGPQGPAGPSGSQNITMLSQTPLGGTSNVRNTWVNTNLSIDVNESGTYMIFYKILFNNLLGNTISLPSDRYVDIQLIAEFNGELTVLDGFQLTADIESIGTGASAWHFRPTERVADMSLKFLDSGAVVGLRFRVADNGIAPTPNDSYTYGGIEVYGMKVN